VATLPPASTIRAGCAFSVYQQVATRRYIDEEAIWTVMRFADEPAERLRGRQLTRVQGDDPRGPVTKGQFE
jgi:hypothetical protein